jgi:hypothetical protein
MLDLARLALERKNLVLVFFLWREEAVHLKDYFLCVQDKLMTAALDSSSSRPSRNWIFKSKEHGKSSAAASLVLYSILFFFLLPPNFYC